PARGAAGARHGVAELLGRVLQQWSVLEPLLVAHLDPAQIEYGVSHRDFHPLAPAGAFAVEQRGENAGNRVHAGAAVADLGAGHGRRAIFPARRARCPAHALCDILVSLEVGVAAGSKALDRGIDHARIKSLEALPGE